MNNWLNAEIHPCCNVKNRNKYPQIYIERDMFDGKEAIKISIFQFAPQFSEKGISITLPKKIARKLAEKIMYQTITRKNK